MDNLNPDLNKVKELALKLKEMADRGTEHERLVAENKLTTLLNKYGLTLQDIQNNETKKRTFIFKHEDETLILAHVIWSVIPNIAIRRIGKQKKAFCDLSPEQYIEVKEKLKFYLSDYDKQKKNFTIAYIYKNDLEVKESNEKEDIDSADNYDTKSIVDMMKAINDVDFESTKKRKQIEN